MQHPFVRSAAGRLPAAFSMLRMDVSRMLFALKVDGAAKEWNGKRLFENASLNVSVGERVALIGRNGIGKTSFIEGIMGRSVFEEGVIERGIPLEAWGWIEQEIRVGRDMKLFDFVHSARRDLHECETRYGAHSAELGGRVRRQACHGRIPEAH